MIIHAIAISTLVIIKKIFNLMLMYTSAVRLIICVRPIIQFCFNGNRKITLFIEYIVENTSYVVLALYHV